MNFSNDVYIDSGFNVALGVFVPNYLLMHKQLVLETTRYLLNSATIFVNSCIRRILCSLFLFNFNFQKQRAVVGDVAVAVNAAHVHQKKVAVKPKPEDIIVISPDTEEVDSYKHLNRKKATEGCSKKKGQTFTSTLTARSKVHIFI